MALNLKLGNAVANAEADAAAALFNSGYLRIYDGAQPAGPDVAVGAQVLLAELRFGNPAFAAAVAGVLTANAITSDSSADNTGTAAWFRAFKSDGTTPLIDGSVGVAGCNLNLASVAIQAAVQVAVSSFQLTVTK